MTAYSANMGVALLKNKTYKSFILDFDFQGSRLWTQVGFGAENTENGAYWTNDNGGCVFILEYDGGKGATDFWYRQDGAASRTRMADCFTYNATGTHHMQILVSGDKAYMSVDYQTPWCVDLPKNYDGGHVYFALNNPACSIDNLKITDLDVKQITLTDIADVFEDQTIDRAAGDSISFPSVAYGRDENGYEYPMYLTFDNKDYRSYKEDTFRFRIGMQEMHNLKLADSFGGFFTVINSINGDFNTAKTRKYYFDHPNDFLDFDTYYAQQSVKENYWPSASDPARDEYWSTYDADLVKADAVTDKWKINTDGTVSNAYTAYNPASSPAARLRNVSTMMLRGMNLKNFRLEMDVLHGSTYWYNYLVFGVQDPSKFYAGLRKNGGAMSTGANTGFTKGGNAVKGGVWAFLEREGTFNVAGNLDGGLYERITTEPDGYNFIENYDYTQWHHWVIEVKDGVMKFKVDDSMSYYFYLAPDAIGGLVGFASHGIGSRFDNFEITALDTSGREVAFADAEYGYADEKTPVPAYSGWDARKKKWLFDYSKDHTE